MSKVAIDVPPKGGFSFDLCRRNEMLSKKGVQAPSFLKTGTTIVGLVFQSSAATAAPPTLPPPPPLPLLKPSSASPPPTISTKIKTTLYFFVPIPGAQPHAVILDVEERWLLRHLRVPTRILQRFGSKLSPDGVILGADTRATEGPIVADKNCEKIHFMAPNIYCCGAGTAADTEAVTGIFNFNVLYMVSSQLKLHSYQGYVQAALVLGGVDVTGPHLHTIYPHGSTDTLPFVTMGSGSLAAMAIFESKYREGLTRDEGVNLVTEAICSGIFNDLGSGSNVDVCVITKGNTDYLRNHKLPNPRTYVNAKGYSFTKKTEVLLTKITPLREKVEVIEGGDAMEE
ncbi:20S proteasome beta subunit PBB2 [Actinidia rufa]|uniref:20S proteasome beta subunit PBB2 n=1 Tax=Actinidia rufa TaxID=165716 RepID=A0A7J0HE07_9ERIC|nr:20S proteasome beta subunit PBB2 [Actinidia rufa]